MSRDGPGSATVDQLPCSPASERNKVPIGEVLGRLLPPAARVLEIGAGTGQHAVYFSRLLPGVHWQASDVPTSLPLLARRIELQGQDALPPPLALDVRDEDWPAGPFDAVYTANTLHIMPFELTERLINKAAAVLRPGGRLICYGPFHDGGIHTSPSNEAFDRSLRQRNPDMGIRDAMEVQRLARMVGLVPEADYSMPTNNRILSLRKPASANS